MMRCLSILICLVILASCATRPPDNNVGHSAAPPTNIGQFENRLAEKLLHLAFVDIKEADSANRSMVIEFHQQRVQQAVDFTYLSNHNRLQIRVLDTLLKSEQAKTSTPESAISQLVLESSLGLDGKSIIQLAQSRLDSLQSNILLTAVSDKQPDLTSYFDSIRDDADNYLPDTESGRQEYLTLIVNQLLEIEQKLPLFISPPAHKELSIVGFRHQGAVAVPIFNYDQDTSSLEVDLTEMGQLPRFEIEAAALFYGVPGLHTITSTRNRFEIQSLAVQPAYTRGWAAYTNSNLDRIPQYQHPTSILERSYYELFFVALAIVDYSINTQQQSDVGAIDFLTRNSPYPVARIQRCIQLVHQFPGLYFEQFMGLLEFEALRLLAEESLKGNFDLVEFHNHIVALGPLPFNELRRLMRQWIRQRPPGPIIGVPAAYK